MSLQLTRTALRRPRFVLRQARSYASVAETANAAKETAKETASQAASKASEGLSKVSTSANSVAQRAGGAVSGATGFLGRTVGAVQSMIPPTVHYSKVAWEMSRIVFENRKMSLPSGAQFQSYYHTALGFIRNPSRISSAASSAASSVPTTTSGVVDSVRNLGSRDLTGVAVVAAEVLGFFTVGEMVGRLKIVGYRGGKSHGEHH